MAQRAETCLSCGAHLKERKRLHVRPLAAGDLWLPLLAVAALAVLWLWKPWQLWPSRAEIAASNTTTATPTPTATLILQPTATPLQSPTPTPSPTLPPNQTVHTVKKGETVVSIAKLYGTTAKAVLAANGLKANSTIHAGDQLIIPLLAANTPTPTPTPLPTPTPIVYVVKTGDTLSEIAKRYGTTVELLLQANNLSDATSIRSGTRLTIVLPAGAAPMPAYQVYRVVAGDTLSGIATKFKVTVAVLKQFNDLKSDVLQIGQQLKIPAEGAVFVPTPTPTPSPEPTETVTPTPTPPYRAPAPLAPSDGANFEGADAAILINWASVGILGEDEWYVLHVRRTGPVTEQLAPVWTRATSWRVPSELYVGGLAEPQRFYWFVSVMRKSGEAEDGFWLGEEISPRSATRTFSWK